MKYIFVVFAFLAFGGLTACQTGGDGNVAVTAAGGEGGGGC